MSLKHKKLIITVVSVILLIALSASAVLFLQTTSPEDDKTPAPSQEPSIGSSPGSSPEMPPESPTPPEPSPEPSPEPTPEPSPPEPSPEPTPEPLTPATDITDTLTVTISDGKRSTVLLDRDYTTGHVFRSDASIQISAPEDVHSLYIIWALPPGEWELLGSETIICGKDGFIHEFIKLPHPESELTIQLSEGGASLRDIYAFSKGAPPDWVQVWLPPLPAADLLILPTHADDEHLFFAGILPYYAGERGLRVQVAYLTNHWNQPPRPHELLNGLWVVGVRNYPVISGFDDRFAETLSQATAIYGWDRIVDFQVELIRRFRPLVVVGHDLNGEYGHGVHMLNAHTIRAAVDLAADGEYHPESSERYGLWNTPKLYLHMYRENSITMDWSVPLERFNGATAYEMAVRGYDCHRSQHQWAFRVPSTGPSGHLFGLARSLVGNDAIGGDLFENIYLSRG